MIKKIEKKLYKMWLFREEANGKGVIYDLRNARLSGAISLLKAIGYDVGFNPLANENENPFTVKEIKGE